MQPTTEKYAVSGMSHKYEQNPRFGECYTCFGCEAKRGVVRILVIFQDRPCSAIRGVAIK